MLFNDSNSHDSCFVFLFFGNVIVNILGTFLHNNMEVSQQEGQFPCCGVL